MALVSRCIVSFWDQCYMGGGCDPVVQSIDGRGPLNLPLQTERKPENIWDRICILLCSDALGGKNFRIDDVLERWWGRNLVFYIVLRRWWVRNFVFYDVLGRWWLSIL